MVCSGADFEIRPKGPFTLASAARFIAGWPSGSVKMKFLPFTRKGRLALPGLDVYPSGVGQPGGDGLQALQVDVGLTCPDGTTPCPA